MISKFTKRGLLGVGLLATAAACSQPPRETITAAEQAEEAAVTAGAEEYASAAMSAVAQAKAALQAEITVQQQRWAIRRSYGRAEELAVGYRQAAERAASAAGVGREEARSDATTLIEESTVLLEEVRGMLASAPRGKGTSADLAALSVDLDGAAELLDEAETLLGSEGFMNARVRATSAREAIDEVKAAIEQALGMQVG